MAEIMQLDDPRLTKVLSYPKFCEEKYHNVVEELKTMSVENIASMGRLQLGKFHALGKGCISVVIAGNIHGRTVALKVLRSDANRLDLMGEASRLSMANECGVGPRLIASAKHVIAMDYIEGSYLIRWLKEARAKEELVGVLREILKQCYELDQVGLDHGELSNAKKHILIDSRGSPFIIDFETASTKRRARNLISILSYIFLNENIATLICKCVEWEDNAFLNSIRNYKHDPSKATYEAILSTINFVD